MRPHLWTLNFPLQHNQIFIDLFLFYQGIYYVNIFSLFAMFFNVTKMYFHLLLTASIIAKQIKMFISLKQFL